MLTSITPIEFYDYRQYAVWLISIIVVALGFKYAKEVIAFVLDKLYQVFIQENTAGI